MGVFEKSGAVKPPVAGAGSNVDPTKPAYRTASGYTVEEKVNSGLRGGKKGKVTPFHGQSADGSGEKDDLVPQTSEQKDAYRARGSDFAVKRVAAKTGQSGAGDAGFSAGYNELATYSPTQEGSRHQEDDGPGEFGSGTPVPGDRSRIVASMFPVSVNDGDTGEIEAYESVNLQTGHIECSGARTPVMEVPENTVSIGAPPKRNMSAGKTKKDY